MKYQFVISFTNLIPFILQIFSFDNRSCGAREGRYSNSSDNIVTSRRQHNFHWWHNMVCCPSWGFSSWFAECIRLGLWTRNGRLQRNPRGWTLFQPWHPLVPCILCFQQLLSTEWKFWYRLQFWRSCHHH